MRRGLSRFSTALLGVVGAIAFAAAAAAEALTFDEVVSRARVNAFDVRFAEARLVEARGRLSGARALSQENPALSATAGERRGDVDSDESEIALTIPFGLGLERGPRVAMAESDLLREEASLLDARRLAIGRASAAFYGALHAERLVAIAEERQSLADSLLETARARERAGDVAQFDVAVAESERGRAESELAARRADVARALGDLAKAIGLASIAGLQIEGELSDVARVDSLIAWGTAPERPDVAAARAHVAMRTSELQLAGRERLPDIALLGSSAREEGDEIVQAGAEITLPIFQRGQGSRGEAQGRRELAESEHDAALAAAAIERESAEAAYAAANDALSRFEENALPRALAYNAMATESYRVGRMDLPALLLIRKEALETQREHADRMHEKALAAIDVAVARGLFQ
jgi:outer membrane protein, heavy metal efflux system